MWKVFLSSLFAACDDIVADTVKIRAHSAARKKGVISLTIDLVKRPIRPSPLSFRLSLGTWPILHGKTSHLRRRGFARKAPEWVESTFRMKGSSSSRRRDAQSSQVIQFYVFVHYSRSFFLLRGDCWYLMRVHLSPPPSFEEDSNRDANLPHLLSPRNN